MINIPTAIQNNINPITRLTKISLQVLIGLYDKRRKKIIPAYYSLEKQSPLLPHHQLYFCQTLK